MYKFISLAFVLLLAGAISATAQDLIISNSNFSASSTKHAGGEAVVRYEVKNIGTQTVSQNTTVRFYLSSNTTLDNNDYQFPVTDQVGILSPQNSDDENANLTIPVSWSPGSYYILIQADANDVVAETNENNNIKYTPITVTAARADLFVFAGTVPATAKTGDTFDTKVSYGNNGSIDAGAAKIAVYASANNTFEAGTDVLLGSIDMPGIGTEIADRLRPTLPTSNPWPENITGSVYVLFVADADGQVVELDEANNVHPKAINVSFARPDLTVSASAPTSAGTGTSIAINVAVQNIGTQNSPATAVQLYLSSNTSIDGADLIIGTLNVGGIAPGASASGSSNYSIPNTLTAGTYYILSRVDGANTIAELNENNNTSSRPITLTAGFVDLQVSVLTVNGNYNCSNNTSGHPGVRPNNDIVAAVQVRNAGTLTAAGTFTVEFWLSSNTTLSKNSDTRLNQSVNFRDLAPGATDNSDALFIPLPNGIASSNGTWYIIAEVDSRGRITENNEGNNTRNKAVYVVANVSACGNNGGGAPAPGGGGGTPPSGPGLLRVAPAPAPAFSLSTYPNPAQGSTTVSLGAVGNYNVQLVDAQGRQVMQRQVQNANSAKLDLAGLQKGIYLLKAQGTAGIKTQRLVVQ